MFKTEDLKIKMVEGDYNITLPIEIDTEETITPQDYFSIKIFAGLNEEPIITKTYSDISNKTINFQLTKEESGLLQVGYYLYDIDYYQENNFLGNIIKKEDFIVEEKAGVVDEN